jgi:hypothetical protein
MRECTSIYGDGSTRPAGVFLATHARVDPRGGGGSATPVVPLITGGRSVSMAHPTREGSAGGLRQPPAPARCLRTDE